MSAYIILYILELIIIFNLIFPMVLFMFWKAGKTSNKQIVCSSVERDYAIIVTAYKQTDFIPEVVSSILDVNYSNFIIYIVADNCINDNNLKFTDERIKVLFPKMVLANNISSHFHAINNFVRDHDTLMIVDSDNVIHPELINELNAFFDQGYKAVQGVRMAKNLDTPLSCLDAARDIYYHFYDGKVLFDLGSSATLSGSGMAFDVNLYKRSLTNVVAEGAGFDKVLQFNLVNFEERIAYSNCAIIYDQKTSNSEQLINQRSRWLNTWFKYFYFGFVLLFKGIKNVNWNQFLFGLILLRPPLFMFLSLAMILSFLNLFFNVMMSICLLLSLFTFMVGFLISLMNSKTDKKIYSALIYIPNFIFFQLISLVKSGGSNKKNVATKHYYQDK